MRRWSMLHASLSLAALALLAPGASAKSLRVIDLAAHPTTCVRLDRPVIYEGQPGPDQNCPAHAVGRRRAILLGVSALPGGADTTRSAPPIAHTASAIYTGKGFDACAAPSPATMSAWSASPYRAIGVYVGGENMGCAQPNLTSTWVSGEVAAGWHLIPTYVGKQAPGNTCGCSSVNASRAGAQGKAAADDAVSNVALLGIPAGNPIYYDMEGYSSGGSTTTTVLRFLSAWTTELHARGYVSGIYSSGASGITDLVNAQGSSYAEPDDIWIADWNGHATTSDPYVPAKDWSQHQRVHQYRGDHNETYGGRTINIDNDYLDAATADTSGQATPPPPSVVCVVPKLRRMKYRQAKRALHGAHCSLGKVHWPRNWRRHRHHLRVFSQSPRGGTTRPAGYAVRIRLTYRPF